MTLVLADGTIAKTGGKVVKNVAGYDLHKLMIGAFGTLAVTTEVTFRLHPLRSSRATWRMVAASVEPVGKLVAAITTSNLNPEALQVRTVPGGFALDVLLSSAPEVLRSKGEALGAIAASNHTTALVLEEGADPFRQRELLLGSAPGTHVKITAHPTDIPAILSEITHAGGEAVAYPYGVVHAGIGSRDRIPQSLGPLVKPSGGGVSVLGESAEATQLMREIKLKFDPERILNRGFMGGI
jgi:glycolate oxidase FAD binding subunit